MIEYVTPQLLKLLFPSGPPSAEEIVVTECASIDDKLEVVGLGFVAGSTYLVFFFDALDYAGGDADFLRETADAWNNGFVPAASARLVKFIRAEADRETMFLPRRWPLPDPALIWQFSETLLQALSIHVREHKKVLQYFYTPQTPGLDALYNRLARKVERGEAGMRFSCVTRPTSDRGGFYGFERK